MSSVLRAFTVVPATTSFGGQPTPLQTVTGGSAVIVLLVFAALFVATVLSLYLAARLYRGYKKARQPGMLLLGVGLVLFATMPILLRLLLSNVPDVPATTRSIAATASQLVGLLIILGVIYGRR
jgi:hypothetical protein